MTVREKRAGDTNSLRVPRDEKNRRFVSLGEAAKFMPLKPRVSEKAYGQSQIGNVYSFVVPVDSNKQTVASAVAAQFGVTVVTVNIMNVKGKAKRVYRKGRYVMGERPDFKKAYVTIKAGENIPIFAAEEEAEKKAEKAATKATKKEKK